LQAPGIDIDQPGELRDADHAVARKIADMGAPDDRREVMLAMGLELDVPQHHHLVIAGDLVEGPAEIVARLLPITGEPFFVGARDPGGRTQQSLPVRIIAGPANERAHRVFGVGACRAVRRRRAGRRLGLAALPDCNNFTHLNLLRQLFPLGGQADVSTPFPGGHGRRIPNWCSEGKFAGCPTRKGWRGPTRLEMARIRIPDMTSLELQCPAALPLNRPAPLARISQVSWN